MRSQITHFNNKQKIFEKLLLLILLSAIINITNAQQFTWIHGSNLPNQIGNYGEKNVAAPTNVPGARMNAITWVDSENNLYLFGGNGYPEYDDFGIL